MESKRVFFVAQVVKPENIREMYQHLPVGVPSLNPKGW